jgi:hypothetical protein
MEASSVLREGIEPSGHIMVQASLVQLSFKLTINTS